MRGGERKGALLGGFLRDFGVSSMGAKITGMLASSWTHAVGSSDAHLSAPLCPRRTRHGRWERGQPGR